MKVNKRSTKLKKKISKFKKQNNALFKTKYKNWIKQIH